MFTVTIMNKLRHIFVSLFLLLAVANTVYSRGSTDDKWLKWGPSNQNTRMGVIARAGYTIGGTTPMPLPPEIRSIKEFSPKGGFTVGADLYKMVSRRWGVSAGWHFFYEGFHTVAEVKSYKMSLTMEGNTMAGYFTGTDVTNTYMWGMTVPLLATFCISPRWNINAGPYLSAYLKKYFGGSVYDNNKGIGYLRVDTPTGEKVNMDRSNPATYDFSHDMHSWSGGIELGLDWKATTDINVFAKVDWSLSNIWESGFDAVAFRMYPIYATFGAAYRY